MNNIVWIILDSCRYDNFVAARTPNFDLIGKTQKRYTYASWTSPSHSVFLMGLLPHKSLPHKRAADVYQEEYNCWQRRIGQDERVNFEDFLPCLNLVNFLNHLGYRTVARVSLPVLHPATALSHYFYDYRLMDNHNSFAKIAEEISFIADQPTFYFLNLGETHYPYMLNDKTLPHISGVHGVLKKITDTHGIKNKEINLESKPQFDPTQLKRLKNQQVKAIEYCDHVFSELLKKCPINTYLIITSDHGELFGEGGYFGHGPMIHPKVFEVPLIEGPLKPAI